MRAQTFGDSTFKSAVKEDGAIGSGSTEGTFAYGEGGKGIDIIGY